MSGGHNCSIPITGDGRYHPYGGSPRQLRARLGPSPGDIPESGQLHSRYASLASTEIIPETEDASDSAEGTKDGSAEEGDVGQSDASGSDSLFSDGPSLDSDPDLPTLLQILRAEA